MPDKKAIPKQASLFPTTLRSVGAQGVLTENDLIELRTGTLRVALLMLDGGWHGMSAIKAAAGEPGSGCPASEGLRRMRDLRKIDGILVEKKHKSGRTWLYRVVHKADAPEGGLFL